MIVYTTSKELQTEMIQKKIEGKTIGFVPTMGYLHEGHAKLLKQAREENDLVVLSIFVNPLQFGPSEDFDRYPRDFLNDEKVAKNEGVDYIFYPEVENMYPSPPAVRAFVAQKADVLCGAFRPGHFDGVVTVLTKLFNIVQPNRAYFGLKDAQQVAIIESLITDFNFPIQLVKVETGRDETGLAKSSRNVYLSEIEKEEAPYIYQGLLRTKEQIVRGQKDVSLLIKELHDFYAFHLSGETDYIEILAYPELLSLKELNREKIIIAVAHKFSKARLIDNLIMDLTTIREGRTVHA